MELTPVGDVAVARVGAGWPREESRFQRRIVEIIGERPRQAGRRGALQIRRDGAESHRTGLRNRAMVQTGVVLETENVAELSHQ